MPLTIRDAVSIFIKWLVINSFLVANANVYLIYLGWSSLSVLGLGIIYSDRYTSTSGHQA
jgi:hypothetical protein